LIKLFLSLLAGFQIVTLYFSDSLAFQTDRELAFTAVVISIALTIPSDPTRAIVGTGDQLFLENLSEAGLVNLGVPS